MEKKKMNALNKFSKSEKISLWQVRKDALHESEFTEKEIDELKAAGLAYIKNAGLNVYYVCLTAKGKKASGFKFGWFSDNPLLG
jgi:hypothetical protein